MREDKSRRRRVRLFVLALLLFAAICDVGRRIILTSSLYRLNLRTQAPLSQMPPLRAGEKIVIFAPHPDDETLGTGGLIQQAVAAGASIRVVLVTNGEYPSVTFLEHTLRMSQQAFVKLGYRRQRETLRAMQSFGLSPKDVIFLGYPNHHLHRMWLPQHWSSKTPVRSAILRTAHSPYSNSMTPHAPFSGQSLLQDIETILAKEQPDIVITAHPNDMHVDHWTVYGFVQLALNELTANGQAFAAKCRVYTYLIHRPLWPAPKGFHPFRTLEPPARLVATRQTQWLELPLTVAQMIDKRKAIAMYRSQAGPIDPVMQSFARGNELFGIVPVKTWLHGEATRPVTIIIDAVRDMPTSAANPRADIAHVTLQHKEGKMLVRIITSQAPDPRVTFHFSIHVSGKSERDRLIAEYNWKGPNVSAIAYHSGRVYRLDHSVKTGIREGITFLEAPWPVTRDSQAFFMARAWTTRGKHLLDETQISTFSISKGIEALRNQG